LTLTAHEYPISSSPATISQGAPSWPAAGADFLRLRTSDVWFYPWNEADLARYFDADESRWRASSRPAVTDLRLLITPMDWFSQKPESIEIKSADAVGLSMAQ